MAWPSPAKKTDALPRATGALIAAHLAAHLLLLQLSADTRLGLAISYGDGLRPLQWLTGPWLHRDWQHLTGNLLWLWLCGHLLEPVLGGGRLTVLYVVLAVSQAALEQAFFLGQPGGSYGASGAVSALAGAGLVLLRRSRQRFATRPAWTVPAPALLLVLLALDTGLSALGAFDARAAYLHASGVLLGAALAVPLASRPGWRGSPGGPPAGPNT